MKIKPWAAPASCALLFSFSASAQTTETTTYEYDAQGRLIRTEKEGGPLDETVKTTDYDAAGNRENYEVTGAPPPPPS